MDDTGHDRRRSASVNAALLLVAVLLPLFGRIDAPAVDHTQTRPWGCRTCPIPVAPPTAKPDDPGL